MRHRERQSAKERTRPRQRETHTQIAFARGKEIKKERRQREKKERERERRRREEREEREKRKKKKRNRTLMADMTTAELACARRGVTRSMMPSASDADGENCVETQQEGGAIIRECWFRNYVCTHYSWSKTRATYPEWVFVR